MKLMLVTGRYPWPARRGDQLRAVQQLELLARHHAVTLLCPAPPPGAPAPETPGPFRLETYSERGRSSVVSGAARSLTGSLPLQSAFFHQPDLIRKVRELAPAHDLTVLQLVRLAGAVEALDGRPFVIDFIDCLSLNFQSRARVDNVFLRPLWLWEAARIRRVERRLLAKSRAGWVVCRRDRKALAERHPMYAEKLGVGAHRDPGRRAATSRCGRAARLAGSGFVGKYGLLRQRRCRPLALTAAFGRV